MSGAISDDVRWEVFNRVLTRNLADDWRVIEVLMYLNHPIYASRWVEYVLNWRNACCCWSVLKRLVCLYFIW